MARPDPPHALRPGDTVAVVAPSGKVDAARLADGVAMVERWGLRVRVMPSCETGRGYLAGENERAVGEELSDCFADPEVHGILCARGGYGAMRSLPYIDWDAVRANPKPFCGYSDITALHLAIRREAGFPTLHGSMVARQGDEPGLNPYSEEALRRALTATEPLGTIASPPEGPAVQTVVRGAATGVLVGGNLTLIASLCGTPWSLNARDSVLVLEDVNEAPYRIDRMLTQLRLAGVLDGVRGVVFGDSPTCDRPADDPRAFPLVTVLRDRLGDLGVPLLYGFPCGHTPYRAALPLGVPVMLDADAGTLTFPESAFVPAPAAVKIPAQS